MNLWIARGAGPRAEALVMSSVANWFISTKTSDPVNGQVQDSTIGANELTRSAVVMDKYHAMALFAGTATSPPRFDRRPAGHRYTGREVVSLLLAETPINYARPPSSGSEVYAPYVGIPADERLTVIEQGVLVRGVLDKRSVGAKQRGGVFHLISREYGPQRALDMIFALQQMALQFLMSRGFTVGTADLLPSAAALDQIRAEVATAELDARAVTERLLRGEVVPPIDSTVHEFYEGQQRNALKLNEAELLRWILGTIRADTNGFFRMIATGSKGTNPNLIHVSGAIGQTTINGERIRAQFAFGRTRPGFPRFATEPAAYGFVRNSYMTGMTGGEFGFQNQNGRFDLINKALSTASTGYFMRKGVMNNQSSLVDNHRRVTKATRVVQMLYGEDGLDSRELEKVEFRSVALGDAALEAACTADAGAEAASAVAEAVARIRADRDWYRAVFLRLEAVSASGQAFTAELLMPVNVGRIVEGVFIAAKREGVKAAPLTAAGLRARIGRVRDLCDRLPYVLVNEIQERKRAPVPAHKRAASMLVQMLVRFELSPAVLARMTDAQLDFVCDAVRQRYAQSLVDYGTAVGLLAAQSISEPLTQYMLDSHHRSVAGGTSKAGLVRIAEIYGGRAVSEEQTPAMHLPLKRAVLGDAAGALGVAQEIANSIEHVTLESFTRQHDTLLEPYGARLAYPPTAGDAAWIAEFERDHPLVRPPGDLTNWCFRFLLDKAALVLKAIDLELIVGRLRRIHPGFYVVHTQESVPEVVIRCWARASLFKSGGDPETAAEGLLEKLFDTPVRGIRGIRRAAAETVQRHRVGPDGALVKEDQYVIKTAGTNLYSALLHGAVDTTSAVSNSIGDTARLYGIEAARAKIIAETRAFMEDGTPNLRHLFLYADEMTRTGRVTNIERGGLNVREPGNVLLRAAYGAPISVITDAALSGARSQVYGIATPQLLGAVPQIGTLYNSFVVDEAFVKANTRSVNSVLDELE